VWLQRRSGLLAPPQGRLCRRRGAARVHIRCSDADRSGELKVTLTCAIGSPMGGRMSVAVPMRAKRQGIDTPRTEPRRVRRPRYGAGMHESPPRRLSTIAHIEFRCGAYRRYDRRPVSDPRIQYLIWWHNVLVACSPRHASWDQHAGLLTPMSWGAGGAYVCVPQWTHGLPRDQSQTRCSAICGAPSRQFTVVSRGVRVCFCGWVCRQRQTTRSAARWGPTSPR
jgi:hypothetical protein